MEKLFKIFGALTALLAVPVEDRDEKAIRETLKDATSFFDSDEAKGLSADNDIAGMKATVEQLKADSEKAAEELRKIQKMGLTFSHGSVNVLDYDEVIALRRVGNVFRTVEQAEAFAAMTARAIFGKSPRYEELVSERARGMADDLVKDLDPGVAGSGAELVSNIYVADLIAHLEAVGVLYNMCDRVPLQTIGQTIYPKLTGELTAHPTTAAAKIAESAPTYSTVTLTPVKWGVLTPVPNEFFRNPTLLDQLGQRLAMLITRAIAYAADNALVNGDGTADYGGITGLLQDASLTAVTAAAHTSLGAYDANDCGKVIAGCVKDYVTDPYWMFSLSAQRTLRNIREVDAAGGATGQPLFQRGGNGEPNTIDGYPYTTCQRFPAAAAASAAVKWGAFGDLRLSHYFGMLGGIQIDQSEHVRFEHDMTVIRGIAMMDCKVKDADATIIAKTHA